MRAIITIMIFLLVSSCGLQPKRKGYYGKQVKASSENKSTKNNKRGAKKYETDAGIIITGKMNKNLSSKYFGMIDFVFKNNTDEWIRIEKIIANFGDSKINKNIKFVSGRQLKYYFDAIEPILLEKQRKMQKNKQMTAAVFAGLAGGMAASNNGYGNFSGLATGLALGAATSLSISQFNSSKKLATKDIFPEGHLLRSDFVIPPGLETKKWLLINSTNHQETGYISKIYVIYKTKKGKKEKIELTFRSGGGFATWQSDVKGKPKPFGKIF